MDADPPQVLSVGLIVADMFCSPLQRLPMSGELLSVAEIDIAVGGCAANCATGLARLGISAAVVGAVGRDAIADLVIAGLQRNGVDTTLVQRSAAHGTSKTMMLPVIGEDRRYIHTFGANADLGLGHIPPSAVEHARVLYIGGYFGLPAFPTGDLTRILRHAKAHKVTTVVDVIVPTGMFSDRQPLVEMQECWPLIDYFLPNQDEAEALTGRRTPEEQARVFCDLGVATTIITLGAQGCVGFSGNEAVAADVYPVPFVDGAGAGDAFDAGLIAGLVWGKSVPEMIQLGSAMAASCVMGLGCTRTLFDRSQLEAFLG